MKRLRRHGRGTPHPTAISQQGWCIGEWPPRGRVEAACGERIGTSPRRPAGGNERRPAGLPSVFHRLPQRRRDSEDASTPRLLSIFNPAKCLSPLCLGPWGNAIQEHARTLQTRSVHPAAIAGVRSRQRLMGPVSGVCSSAGRGKRTLTWGKTTLWYAWKSVRCCRHPAPCVPGS